MKNKLLNIIKLMSLSAVMVSGGFASRIGQACKSRMQNKAFVLNGGGALACAIYGLNRTDEQTQSPKQVSLALAAALARNACRNQITIRGAIQGFAGAHLINSGYANCQNADCVTKIINNMKEGISKIPQSNIKKVKATLPKTLQNLVDTIISIKNKPKTTYPLHSEVVGLTEVLCGSVLFISRSNLMASLIGMGLLQVVNGAIIANPITLEASYGKENLLEVLRKKIKS